MPSPSKPATDPSAAASLSGEVLVCVCGGIAACKTAMLVSALVQRGCAVTVAMTRAARRFVGPATFQALTGRSVHTSLWRDAAPDEIPHLKLTERADLLLVAPATANIIGKLAGGIADDLVSTLLLGSACPIMMAPAMNERMWAHPAVQRNVDWLGKCGVAFVGPGEGWQACRAVGPGRMAEPDELLAAVAARLAAGARRG